MKKILVILVGGTICSSADESGVLSVSENAGSLLLSSFKNSNSPFVDEAEFTLTENLMLLSENLTVESWNKIIDVYRKYTKNEQYDGVIFAHGTDTLAYTASLFSMLLSSTKIPVFFVSSHQRITLPTANGPDNFKCAVELICKEITPNIYAVYKNASTGKMMLHLASRLEQCKNYSNDFHSAGEIDLDNTSFEEIKNAFPQGKAFINIYDNFTLSPCVLQIVPYVGIDYSAFNLKGYKAILHGTYHCGTACTAGDKNSIFYLAKSGIDTYISPAKADGEIYKSLADIKNSSIKLLYGTTNETAYAKLLIAYSLFDEKQRESFLKSEINFEITKTPQ